MSISAASVTQDQSQASTSPHSGSAESKISGKLQKTTVAKEKEQSGFVSR